MDLSAMRKPYLSSRQAFLEDTIETKEPFRLFENWIKEAMDSPEILEPNAVCLATATKTGMPSVRYMLCKGFDKDNGFKLFTNFASRKGKELEENPNVALVFYWEALKKQVRVEGKVEKLRDCESEAYFKTRPYRSQIGALVSQQSTPVESRDVLKKREEELLTKYPEGQVPKPPTWGGFRVIPHTFEFWQGQSTRVHDRIQFLRADCGCPADGKTTFEGEEGWVYRRLYP